MKYIEPEMEIIFFMEETIIRTSNPDNDVKVEVPEEDW